MIGKLRKAKSRTTCSMSGILREKQKHSGFNPMGFIEKSGESFRIRFGPYWKTGRVR